MQNSPNDLQMLADAPAHHIFVLLEPISSSSTGLPAILCAVQVQEATVSVFVCLHKYDCCVNCTSYVYTVVIEL